MNVVIDGVRYNVELKGSGFPLVLLHGFTGDSSTWAPLLSHWCKDHLVVCIDIIGHGKSESPKDVKRYNILSVSNDLKRILDNLKIEKADLLGYSMGGRLALSFAIKYPSCVRHLILESTSPGLQSEQEQNNRKVSDERLAAEIERNGIERFVEYWGNIPLFSTQKKLPKKIQDTIKKQRLQNSSVGLSNSLRGMGTGVQPSWWDDLQKVNSKTLILTGEFDKKFCLIAEKMIETLKHAEWETIKGCGHAIHVEQAEKFGTIVSRFLSKM